MGQQQLLLIILAVLIIGIAMAIGVNLFTAQSVESNRGAMINDINNLNAHAYQFYIRPVSMGGGGGDLTKYTTIPPKMAVNDNATYTIVSTTQKTITFKGTSVNGTVQNTFNADSGKVLTAYTFGGVFAQ